MLQNFLDRTFRSFSKETHTQTRWGIFQLFISLSLFLIALSIAMFTIYYSFNGGCVVGILILVVGIIALVVGIISAIYAFCLANV